MVRMELYLRSSHRRHDADILIAATALEHGLPHPRLTSSQLARIAIASGLFPTYFTPYYARNTFTRAELT